MLLPSSITIVTYLRRQPWSRVTGINERQLWRYAAGKNVPRKEQLENSRKG